MYLLVEEFLAYQRGQLNCRIETLVSIYDFVIQNLHEVMDERGLEMFQIFHLCFAWHKKVIEADGWCLSALD